MKGLRIAKMKFAKKKHWSSGGHDLHWTNLGENLKNINFHFCYAQPGPLDRLIFIYIIRLFETSVPGMNRTDREYSVEGALRLKNKDDEGGR